MNKHCLYLISFTLCIFLFTACNNNKENDDKQSKIINQINGVEKSIIGKWGGFGETPPVWDIRKDSIYYFQHSKAYAYKIVNNDMIINFENSPNALRNIHVKNDTLFFIDDVGLLIKGYRFR